MSPIGRFIAALAAGLAAGIPVLVGLAIESAVFALIFDSLFGWWPFGRSYPVILALQVVPVALVGLPMTLAQAVTVARDGWPPPS